MSLAVEQSALPESIYTAIDIEWRTLLTLTRASNPGELIKSGQWSASLFGSREAQTGFRELAQSSTPLTLRAPTSVNNLTAFTDLRALQNARQILVMFAQLRQLETMQANLAREMRRLAVTRPVDYGISPILEATRSALRCIEGVDICGDTQLITTLGELASSYWSRLAQRCNAAPTGLGSLDEALGGGLQAQRLIVILGGPGSGKTTLVNQIAETVASQGRPVVYLTTEDPMSTLLAKTVARLGHVDYGAVLQGLENEQDAINRALVNLMKRKSAQCLLYVESNGTALDDLHTVIQRHFSHFADETLDGGSGILIVDYLQRMVRAQMKAMHNPARDLREAVTMLTEELRDLARGLNGTVIAVASQNRASGYGNINAIASAKESGDIEYTADVLISLAKDEHRQAPLRCEARSLTLVKNRLGSQATINLDWRPDRQQFTEATRP